MARRIKFKAFTLIESVVSLTLISVTVGICFLLFNKTATQEHTVEDARLMVDSYFIDLESGVLNSDQSFFEREGLEMDVVVRRNYQQMENLYLVSVSVNKKEKVVYRTQKLVVLDEN